MIYVTHTAKHHALAIVPTLDCAASLRTARYVGTGEAVALGLMKADKIKALKGKEFLFHDSTNRLIWIVVKDEETGNMLAVTVRRSRDERIAVDVPEVTSIIDPSDGASHPFVQKLLARLSEARYEDTTFSFVDVFAGEESCRGREEVDLRIVKVGNLDLVAVDGVLMIADEDLVTDYLLRDCA